MKTQHRHIIIILAFAMASLGFVGMVQAQKGTHYYISLYQSSVNITAAGRMTNGMVWRNNAWEQLTSTNYITINSNDLYEIGMWASGDPAASGNPSAGTTNKVTTSNGGTVEIVNRSESDVRVLSEWDTRATSIGYRSTSNNISIGPIGTTMTIRLNNCWSTHNIGLQFWSNSNNNHLIVELNGDNRFKRIEYLNGAAYPYATMTFKENTTATGWQGTLTVGGANGDNCVIGSCNAYYDPDVWNWAACEAYGLVFESGTIYAGANGAGNDRCTAIGGGGNKAAKVTISGATVTAVTSSRGTAIGGGLGGVGAGGAGTVIISSGRVYAYNYGYTDGSANEIIGTCAIGGGSSKGTSGSDGTVTISGGTVYAKSVGGAAIGGGSSTGAMGGDATISISSPAYVEAISVSGTIGGTSVSAATAIGGGKGSTKGGTISFTMTGGTLKTGSLGGGQKTSETDVYGSGTVNISGGTINGQFLLSPPATGHSEFIMSGGTINGKLSGYTYSQSNGYALWMNDPNGVVTMSGGTIDGCTGAYDGGAIYLTNGSFTMSGDAKIQNCSSTHQGGAIYMTNGSFIMKGGAKIQNCSATNYGGAVYMGGGSVTIQAESDNVPSLDGNSAYAGGALFMNGGSCTITACNIGTTSPNHVSNNGGGLHLNGKLIFSNGNISNNWAQGSGGGVYISTLGEIDISGTANITGNNARTGEGGGVYQNNIMIADGISLNISGNTKGTAKATSPSNVYLPHNKTITVGPNISTSVNMGIYTQRTVEGTIASGGNEGNNIPVLDADPDDADAIAKLNDIYTAMKAGTSSIVDDRNIHRPVHVTNDQYLYFGLTVYDYYYSGYFSNPIHDAEELYQYMCWVNGINGYSEHHGYPGQLAADIDMDGIQYWFPIGMDANPFSGTFEGNGHTISNLSISAIDDHTNYGLFGAITTNADISDVFVHNSSYYKNEVGTMGILVGLMQGGTLKNCGGAGMLSAQHASCIAGGLVGNMTGGTIQSSFAMADMTGYQMGGFVGSMASGSNLYNSFANPKFTHSGSGTEYVGGLVAVNAGHIENCYVRLERAQSLGSAHFGMLAGSNSGTNTIVKCYAPNGASDQFNHSYNYLYGGSTTGLSDCATYDKVIAPYLYNRTGDNAVGSSTLLDKLKAWVADQNANGGSYATWKRTTAGGYSTGAGNINGDYPIHKFTDYKCVASPDGIALDYAPHLYNILKRHTSNATVNLYANDTTTASTGTNVMVYIDEDISLIQNNTTSSITAYTCQTIPGTPRSWHFVSSSLSNSGIGFEYNQYAAFNWDPNPCHVNISATDDQSLFPSDLPKVDGYSDVSKIDLYCFYEPEYHWINLKRRSDSHWHMDAETVSITYPNETTLTRGKGYLISIDQDQLLQNKGTLNNGDVEVTLGYTPDQAWAGLLGYNLIGNPYQSYLNFSAFATQNSTLWYDHSKGKAVEPTYAVYDAEMGGYIQYKQGASRGARTASGNLNMHQGFMVRSNGATRAKFTNTMRTDDGTGVSFRGEQPAYPLINLKVTDDEGVNDFAVLELGREAEVGAEKLRANDCKGWLYLHFDNDDYGILFRTEVEDYQPLWFEAEEAGSYTLSWETANAEFDQLTLFDNITGEVTDMLANDSYVFEANPEQYKSRFKIVVGDYKDTEENMEGHSTGSETFAYYANGEIHLVETQNFASLQIVDVTGRVIRSLDVARNVSTNGMAPGVYILRLITNKGTKIQKMVIE